MNTITLNKKNLKRFIKIFDNVFYLEILEIDILIIDSIKTKLQLAFIEFQKSNSSTQTLTFTIEELRVFKKLSLEYINLKKDKPKTNSNNSAFNAYLKKFKGADNDK